MAVLPDLLGPGVVTVFCGSAAGTASARRGFPYAGPGNKFWPMLHETGLTPRRFAPKDYRELLGHGIGLTDINKTQFGADSDLTAEGDDVAAVLAKIDRYKPRLLAFTAKRPAQVFMKSVFGRGKIEYGLQPDSLESLAIFVLPSSSGLAIRWWDPQWWHRAAALHRELAAAHDA
jgi:double-stranded uracil-DNA glycosylase